jgi:broad specificity phosphatase PhoE
VRRLYLVRHGAAERAAGRAVGHLDLGLSDAGRQAIRSLAATWQGPPPDRLFTSDLARSAASAALLAAAWGVEPRTDARLRELSFGEWEGRQWHEVQREDGERLAAWGARWWGAATPGGESYATLSRRVLRWYAEALPAGSPGVTVAVGHAGPWRALVAELLGRGRHEVWSWRLEPAWVVALELPAAGAARARFLGRPAFA